MLHSRRPFLSVLNASFRLGEQLVFENLCWTFHRNEHWAVVGPNGSGKSLLADALRGKAPLARGELRYHFTAPRGFTQEEAIGHVSFEDRKAEVHETVVQSRWNSLEEEGASSVRDFLSYERVFEVNPFEVTDRHERARPVFERRARQAIRLLGLEGFLDRPLLSLSNGERQRAELARALGHPLRLLILDEPFAGLDAAARKQFGGILDRLMAGRLRVLLVTTRVEELPKGITHWLKVENCRVARSGRRSELGNAAHKPEVENRRLPVTRRRVALRNNSQKSRVLVELRGVTVRYGAATVLSGLDWTVCAGESWALLGPNGSGKTTLLSLIMGDHPQAYSNHVVVFGRQRGSGDSIWELKQRIGWVSPELQVHFNGAVTCLEAVASGFDETVGLFEQPSRKQMAAARGWVRRFELLEFAEHPLFALSAGLQRMVLLARALVKKPELLVLDEPCQGLDGAHRRLFVQTVDALIRSGSATVIYVTHRPEELPPAIRRVLRLEKKQNRRSGLIIPFAGQSGSLSLGGGAKKRPNQVVRGKK